MEAQSRPDRVTIQIGNRQLPRSGFFTGETAQGLLLLANRFLNLIVSGEAEKLQAELPKRGLRRLAPGSH
jgi:hypothetical protein